MKTFKSFLAEAEAVVGVKAGHMTHLEDLVFDLGVEGTRKAINFMRDVRDMLSQGTGGKKAVATVKFDGCVHEDTVIWTNYGDMKIRDLFDNPDIWDSTYVMGKDTDNFISFAKLSKLIDASKTTSDKEWVEVFLENGSSIKLTSDHLVHTTNRGWVEAGKLNCDDDVTKM